ncbi:hypothetical protein SCCGRSA3_01418 [Marine Group I thaumarchaeote SCGC RSA3]|uniref:Uncharacterized protein n=2 Tax=Marine Group I TaxID=905826 RepID=A0A081RPJ5_9ARCH|nr:hypothetical protein AAA799N04_00398 [Marine Group I thaumarchaeote SCGC AAA799-N04]KFM18064.1 hypothetical protein SCCGRSA3_01418 [Marine Group I thaumarchaeote SCGC RSA3]
MTDSDFTCNDCEGEIVEYYHDGYKGKRGKCVQCGQEFPLE